MNNKEWKLSGRSSMYDDFPKYDALKYEMTKKLTNSVELAKLESKRSNSRFILDIKILFDRGIIK